MEESIRQLALVSSVLGGFSFTFMSAILTMKSKKAYSYWVLTLLMIASMCFLLTALGWSLMDFRTNSTILAKHHQSLVKILIFGLISSISALGTSGWMKDRKTGITTSIIGFLSILLLFFMILSKYMEI